MRELLALLDYIMGWQPYIHSHNGKDTLTQQKKTTATINDQGTETSIAKQKTSHSKTILHTRLMLMVNNQPQSEEMKCMEIDDDRS